MRLAAWVLGRSVPAFASDTGPFAAPGGQHVGMRALASGQRR